MTLLVTRRRNNHCIDKPHRVAWFCMELVGVSYSSGIDSFRRDSRTRPSNRESRVRCEHSYEDRALQGFESPEAVRVD